MKGFALAAFGILCVVAMVVGLIENLGWGVVLWPSVGVVAIVFFTQLGTRRYRRELKTRSHIGRMEAEAGIPVIEDGRCRHCQKPLIAGAKFCSYCGKETAFQAVICPLCGTRAQEDALFCPACGTKLDQKGEPPPRSVVRVRSRAVARA